MKWLAAMAAVGVLSGVAGAQPANDNCANATHVSEGTFAFTTVGATRDYAASCDPINGAAPDVWLRYTASASGHARAYPDADAPHDLSIAVLDGSCSGVEVACGGDLVRGRRQVVFPVTAGHDYLVRLSMFFGSATGHVVIAPVSPPANDDCQTAAPISGEGVFQYDNTLAGSSGPDGDVSCQGIGGRGIAHDVWFLWTNTLGPGHDAEIFTCGGTFVDTKMAVYAAGCPVGAPIACNDNDCFQQSQVHVALTPGAQYLIRIGNSPGPHGNDGPDGEPAAFTIQGVPACMLTPPPGALIEPEACGTSTNGGCGSYTDIPCGTTVIFGTAPVVNGVQDLDYYRVVLPVASRIHLAGTAEFRMRMAILDDQCPPSPLSQTIFATHPCIGPQGIETVESVNPGTYTVGVANTIETACSGRTHYIITVTVDQCAPGGRCTADFNGDGDFATDADIEAFFACMAGDCCAACGSGDFNGDGESRTDADIESFFRVLAGGAC